MARLVELPLRLDWSGSARAYDLDDPKDRVFLYETVLREGNADDVRRWIDPDVLLAIWDDLVLPHDVRLAWYDWFSRARGVDPGRRC